MREKKIIILCCFVALVASFFVLKNIFIAKPTIERISKEIDIDCTDGTIIFEEDTHGGFHGDGILFVEISFEDLDILDKLNRNKDWKALPLDKDIDYLRYRSDENVNHLPEVESGYYYFFDPNETYPIHNYILAVYDTTEKILYYCESDR